MDTKNTIIPPEKFLVVRHGYLNRGGLELEREVELVNENGKYTCRRAIVPCFEGDLVQLPTGEAVFTHQSFRPLSEARFRALREQGIATSLREVLDHAAQFRDKNPDVKLWYCFELKPATTEPTVQEAIRLLGEYRLGGVYFDSFFGGRLDIVDKANSEQGTHHPKSLHLLGNVYGMQLSMTHPVTGYDVVTVPSPVSFGRPGEPVIYGAVGDPKTLERIARDPQAVGAYVRFNARTVLRMIIQSVTNRPDRGSSTNQT